MKQNPKQDSEKDARNQADETSLYKSVQMEKQHMCQQCVISWVYCVLVTEGMDKNIVIILMNS